MQFLCIQSDLIRTLSLLLGQKLLSPSIFPVDIKKAFSAALHEKSIFPHNSSNLKTQP